MKTIGHIATSSRNLQGRRRTGVVAMDVPWVANVPAMLMMNSHAYDHEHGATLASLVAESSASRDVTFLVAHVHQYMHCKAATDCHDAWLWWPVGSARGAWCLAATAGQSTIASWI